MPEITIEQNHTVVTRITIQKPVGDKDYPRGAHETHIFQGKRLLIIRRVPGAKPTVEGEKALFKYYPEELLNVQADGWTLPSWGV